ncbi:MAG: cobalt-zinc-cadmium efflux system outer membrane protein [Arenicella sp.]|jgi:cobalt-zinc-cadmium efflux system outer membrane protein
MKKHRIFNSNDSYQLLGTRLRRCVIQKLALLIGLVASATPIWAEESLSERQLTLEAAITIAIRDNPSLAQINARYDALQQVPSQVSTLPDPTINLNAMNFPTDTFDRRQEAMTQMQLGFSQQIPFPGKLSLKKEVAEFDAMAAGHSVQELRAQLRNKVASKWWQLHYLDRSLETVANNQNLLRRFITVAKTKYETGEGLQQDVLLAQLELSKLMDRVIQVEAIRQTQAIRLNILMDRLPSERILLSALVSTNMPELREEAVLYDIGREMRSQLKVVQSKIDAAQSRLKLAKRNYYPDFMVGMTYGDRSGMNPLPRGDQRADFASLMVGIKVPLYAGRKQAHEVAQRRSELAGTQHAQRDETGIILSQISTAITDYHRAKQQFLLFETGIIPQARQTVASMLAGYQVNQVDFLNLVGSQITLFNYELQYWKALSEANQALARLQAAVGEESIYE